MEQIGGAYFTDKKRLYPYMACLVINCENVVRKFGSLKEFILENDLGGLTNGELLFMAEMNDPPWGLYKLADGQLTAKGLVEKEDFVFLSEPLMVGAGYSVFPGFNQPVRGCEGIPWLGSLVYSFESFYTSLVWLKKADEPVSIGNIDSLDEIVPIDDEFPCLPEDVRNAMKSNRLVRVMRDLRVPLTQESYLFEALHGFGHERVIREICCPDSIPSWIRLLPKGEPMKWKDPV